MTDSRPSCRLHFRQVFPSSRVTHKSIPLTPAGPAVTLYDNSNRVTLIGLISGTLAAASVEVTATGTGSMGTRGVVGAMVVGGATSGGIAVNPPAFGAVPFGIKPGTIIGSAPIGLTGG